MNNMGMGHKALRFLKEIDASLYPVSYFLVWPINRLMLSIVRRRLRKAGSDCLEPIRNSQGSEERIVSECPTAREEEAFSRPLRIAHISVLFTKPYLKTRALRELGVQADYIVPRGLSWLRVGTLGYDRYLALEKLPKVMRPFKECFLFWWRGLTDYGVYHYHFLAFLTESGWDLKYLKELGKKVVIHFGGCDIREEAVNRRLHPDFNICQECTYDREYCSGKFVQRKRKVARRYGDLFLVTTPDMRDFMPEAHHLPFTSPPLDPDRIPEIDRDRSVVRIVHTSNHEGIDGTRYLVEAVDRLKEMGYRIELVHPRQVSHEEALKIYQSADIAVGKLKMGYYANFQIETMALGKPTLCYIRPDLTASCPDIPILNTRPETLLSDLKALLDHPESWAELGAKGRAFVARYHDNREIGRQLLAWYRSILKLKA